jgi:hypothetical protein
MGAFAFRRVSRLVLICRFDDPNASRISPRIKQVLIFQAPHPPLYSHRDNETGARRPQLPPPILRCRRHNLRRAGEEDLQHQTMQTLADIAKALNRPAVMLSGLQNRFELPAAEGAGYPDPYLAFLRTIVYLRTFGIAEDRLLRLWQLEKKLLQLLHVDSTGSKTWFLDSCGAITYRNRRLLLTNYDVGIAVPARALQLGLNFATALPELFACKEMGEDALRILNEIISLQTAIRADVAAEVPHLRQTAKWATRLAL